jgi:hypothetical protein
MYPYIAARARQTRDKAAANRIARDCKDDGDFRGGLLKNSDSASIRDDDVDLLLHELSRNLGDALGAAFRIPILDRDGTALDPTQFTQSVGKGGSPWGNDRRPQVTDRQLLTTLLRARRERPCGHAAERG